jgi:hypothetical protein
MIQTDPDFQELLNKDFKLVEIFFEGAVNIYSSKDLRLRIVKDHDSNLYVDLSTQENPTTPEDWIMLADLRSYMLKNDDYLTGSDFEEVSVFFVQNYLQIVHLLKTNYSETKNALKERGNKRADLLFG